MLLRDIHSSPAMSRLPRTIYIVMGVLSIGILLTVLNVFELRRLQDQHFSNFHGSSNHNHAVGIGEAELEPKSGLVVWVKAKNPDSGYLKHVYRVFERLGFAVEKSNSPPVKWDVLWHHDYPFLDKTIRPIMLSLEPHQKTNHVPGSGYYTSKVNLATSNITGIPKAYKLPDEKDSFLSYAKQHTGKMWIQKSNKHRGIRILKLSELDLSQENSFVQEYISNPLLVDGRKFDIGVYTVITSIKPLRVYVYTSDILLRFCAHNYNPFDASDLDKYVVGDEYTPTWEISSLAAFYSQGQFTFKQSLNAYLESKGKDSAAMWTRVHNTILQVLRTKETLFNTLLDKYKNAHKNFFELSRFDFVLDEDLNVFLMEANMSPNLSSGHFPPNRLLYEQVIFNLLNVVGLAFHQSTQQSLVPRSSDEADMRVDIKNIMVHADVCASQLCAGCLGYKCQVCARCMTLQNREILKIAYLEHIYRMNMKRIIPERIMTSWRTINSTLFQNHLNSLATDRDRLMQWWFHGMCMLEQSWC